MTNAKKYLKDDVNLEEFAKSIVGRFFGEDSFSANDYIRIKNWSEENTKPTLSEDERVILRNLDGYTKIGRTEKDVAGYTDVYIEYENACESLSMFKSNLFQFIKERRRI